MSRCSRDEYDYGWYKTKFKINNSDLKNEENKPTVRVASLGQAFHVWLNGEYLDMVAMMRRVDGHCQDPASVAFSVLNLAMHFHGWLSIFITLYYKLPPKQDKTVRQVTINTDVDITKTLDYSSAIAILGFSLIVSILRTFDVRVEAARVMVSPPVLAFVTSHIISMFTCWNMIVCVAMGVAQIFLWARWAAVSRHPSNWKLWVVVIASCLAMVLEIYDFPLRMKAHSIWHLATVPLTVLWWSFIRDNVEFRTSSLLKKSKT
uniref:Post-GPI attachment to proteins factor 3 n=1 Tax=Brassica oleracea var. oleracea TaxID=109376 RepID=A0A0D2ZV76_BRAOL